MLDFKIYPTRLRAWWLVNHARRNPDHLIVGYSGIPLRCGTCLGIPPGKGLAWELRPKRFARYEIHDNNVVINLNYNTTRFLHP